MKMMEIIIEPDVSKLNVPDETDKDKFQRAVQQIVMKIAQNMAELGLTKIEIKK